MHSRRSARHFRFRASEPRRVPSTRHPAGRRSKNGRPRHRRLLAVPLRLLPSGPPAFDPFA